MIRLGLLPLSLLAACLLAGAYGALHNQISYTVAPSYFHDFKFIQFAIAPELQNRLGASLVGWSASWWLGFIVGLLLYLAGLLIPQNGAFVRQYLKSAIIVIVVALLTGLTALAASFVVVDAGKLPTWMIGREVSEPVAFARAGVMHNFSYLGAVLGLVAGIAAMVRAGLRARRAA